MTTHSPQPMKLKAVLLAFALGISSFTQLVAQQTDDERDAAYSKVLAARADKILGALDIADSAKAARVREIIVHQYRSLSAIHDQRDAAIAAAKRKQSADALIQTARDEASKRQKQLHVDYLARLSRELTPEQVDKVKDGMTYGLVHSTHKAYLQKFPNLTDEQKAQIMSWLLEAREIAMDAGASEEKHQCFRKYKGKINNYLSAAGYDLNPKK